MSRIWFIADTHLGHGNIIKYCNRPFLGEEDKAEYEARGGTWHEGDWKGRAASRWRMSQEAVDIMDNTVIDGINAKVRAEDTLWHLGDFALPGKHDLARKCRAYRDRINCQHINIVWGNHDRRDEIRDLFERAYDLVKVSVEGQKAKIVLCHYAIAVWDESHRGSWHLYGHSHGMVEDWLDAHMTDRKSIDVGVDNAFKIFGEFRPFSLEDLRSMLMSRMGHTMNAGHRIENNAPREEDLA
jgi:calcineurin-like phosphoesterase family protein